MTSNTFEISPELKSMVGNWQTHERKRFNIFRMVSAIYYRENFHSDILKVLLEGHRDSLGFLINLLNTIKPSLKIEPDKYSSASIEREPGRIDILIKSVETKRCIIVENKINDADDMNEQLSRYLSTTKLSTTKKQSLETDAIVYLSLDGTKEPSPKTYQEVNRAEVEEKLVRVPAFNNGANDLIAGWLEPLQKNKEIDDDFRFTILQYIDIIKELGENCMNTETKKQFNDWIKQDDGNLMECERIAELFGQRHEFALRCMAKRYDRPDLKNGLKIVSTKVEYYRGGYMLTIWVKAGNSNQVIEISDCVTYLSLCAYGDPGDSSAKTVHERYLDKIAELLPCEGEVRCKHFNWPKEERQLIDTADRLIGLFAKPV